MTKDIERWSRKWDAKKGDRVLVRMADGDFWGTVMWPLSEGGYRVELEGARGECCVLDQDIEKITKGAGPKPA